MTKTEIKSIEIMIDDMFNYSYDQFNDTATLQTHSKTAVITAAKDYISKISAILYREEDKAEKIRIEERKAAAEEIIAYLIEAVEALEDMIALFESPLFTWDDAQELWEESYTGLMEVVNLSI